MSSRFSHKVAVVTGVSDRGIGGAIAERIASEGGAVAALFLGDQPKRLLKKLGRIGEPVLPVHCDITDPASVEAAVDAVMAEFGQIDLLVNNAGVDRAATLEELSDEDWDLTVGVNLTGSMRMTRACLKYLAEPGGAIVNIASALALGGAKGFGAYAASKAGLIGLTQTVAAEIAEKGQRAVCVAPALVHTPMLHQHIASATPADLKRMEDAHPLGTGIAQDVASAVAFLGSDEARWVTGVTLPLGYLNQFPLPYEALSSKSHQTVPEKPLFPHLHKGEDAVVAAEG